jgi:hypothetical protein
MKRQILSLVLLFAGSLVAAAQSATSADYPMFPGTSGTPFAAATPKPLHSPKPPRAPKSKPGIAVHLGGSASSFSEMFRSLSYRVDSKPISPGKTAHSSVPGSAVPVAAVEREQPGISSFWHGTQDRLQSLAAMSRWRSRGGLVFTWKSTLNKNQTVAGDPVRNSTYSMKFDDSLNTPDLRYTRRPPKLATSLDGTRAVRAYPAQYPAQYSAQQRGAFPGMDAPVNRRRPIDPFEAY